MNYKCKKCIQKFFAILLALSLFLSGCGAASKNETGKTAQNATDDEEVLEYTVPLSRPYILIDQLGYYPGSTKTALFVGNNMPAQFQIIDADTKEVVYTGDIEYKGYNEATGENISIGTFTGLTMEGEYYVVCDTYGQSYHFLIEEDVYQNAEDMALESIADRRWEKTNKATEENITLVTDNKDTVLEVSGGWYTGNAEEKTVRDVELGCEAMTLLLMKNELYPVAVTDKKDGNVPEILQEASYEALWLLKMQDAKSGAVYAQVTTEEDGKSTLGQLSVEATEAFAAAMAKFSYSYKNYDNSFATLCLRAADKAFQYLEANKKQVDEDMFFYAATELYRASGGYRYHTAVLEHLKALTTEEISSQAEFYGFYIYISTKLTVDRTLCASVMKNIMKRGEEIAANAKLDLYQVDTSAYQDNVSNLLWNMTVMTVIDYIIGNHEYNMLLQNHLHYLLGRNPQALSIIDGMQESDHQGAAQQKLQDNIVDTAALIFMMSEIKSE